MSFDEQYKQQLDAAIIDLIPSVDAPVILIFPGWSETPWVYEYLLKELFQSKRVICLQKTTLTKKEEQIKKLITFLKKKNITKYTLLAHSSGCILAIDFALKILLSGTKIDKIILYNPAGIIDMSITKFLTRGAFHVLQNCEALFSKRHDVLRGIISGFQYGIDLIGTLREALLCCKNTDLLTKISLLVTKGIQVTIVGMTGDKFYPAKELSHMTQITVYKGKHDDFYQKKTTIEKMMQSL